MIPVDELRGRLDYWRSINEYPSHAASGWCAAQKRGSNPTGQAQPACRRGVTTAANGRGAGAHDEVRSLA